MKTVYVASRASIPERSVMWRELRDFNQLPIISTWIDEAGPGQSDMAELWPRICSEVKSADVLLLYAEPTDFPLKGAFVEVGMALAHNKPVWILSRNPVDLNTIMGQLGSWTKHPLVKTFNWLYEVRHELRLMA